MVTDATSRSWISGLAVAGFAVLVQAAYLAEGGNDPTFQVPLIDSATYHEAAVRFAEGGPLAVGAFWQPPLFAMLMGMVYWVVGPQIVAVKVLLVALAVLDCVALWWIGKLLFTRRTGVIAGLMLALYGPFVFYSTQLLPVGLAIFLMLAAFCLWLRCLHRPGSFRWFFPGLAVGAATLTVTNAVVLLPLFMAATLVFLGRDKKWSQAMKAVGLMPIGTVVAVLPVTIRNHAGSGEWVVISTNGGINFFIGNNPESDATIALRPGEPWDRLIRGSVAAGAATQAEQGAYFTHLALGFVVKQPGQFLAGLGHKTGQLLAARELPRNEDPYVFRDFSRVLSVLMWQKGGFGFPWGVVAPLAFMGSLLTRRKFPMGSVQGLGRAVLMGWPVIYGASVVVFFVSSRYRLPLVPPLIVFAAAALDTLLNYLGDSQKPRRSGPIVVAILAGILSGLVVNRPIRAPNDGFNFRAEMAMCVGQRFTVEGQWEAAESQLRTAISLNPSYAEAHAKLANLLAQTGRLAEAEGLAEKACALDQDSAEARWVLGDVLHRQERLPEAAEAFREALRVDGTSPEASAGLAEVLRRSGGIDSAIVHYRNAARFASDSGPTLLRLADLFVARGEFTEAIKCYRGALRSTNPNAATLNSIAWLLATCPQIELRDGPEALRLAKRACALTGYNHAAALDTLAAAHAECRDFQEAVKWARRAFDLAMAGGDQASTKSIQERLKLYEGFLNGRDGLKNARPPSDP